MKVVQLKSADKLSCQEFRSTIEDRGHYLENAINHYLEHGYKLLHVGQETEGMHDGGLWQMTVAVLSN